MYKNLRSSKDNNILLHVANYKDLEIHKKKKNISSDYLCYL